MIQGRFIDRRDKYRLIKSTPDFYLRRHGLPSTQLIMTFIVALLLTVVLSTFLSAELIWRPDRLPVPLSTIAGFILALALVVTGIALFSFNAIRKFQRFVTETEFQSLAFASAMRAGARFTLIVNRDRQVLYADALSLEMLQCPNIAEALNALLAHTGWKDKARASVEGALHEGKAVVAPLEIEENLLQIDVQPLERPSGFLVIRAYNASTRAAG